MKKILIITIMVLISNIFLSADISDELLKRAENGDVYAQKKLSDIYYDNHQYEKYFEILKLISQKNNKAKIILSFYYLTGGILEKNKKKASKIYEEAIEDSDFDRNTILEYNQIWNRIIWDYEELLNKAKTGDAEEQYKLAKFLKKLSMIPLAEKWFKKAAEKEHVKAQISLANIYKKSFNGENNRKLSDKYYKKAYDNYLEMAEKGDSEAQYIVARSYIEGYILEKKNKKGLYYLKKAAKKNHPKAQFFLARNYYSGKRGLKKDFTKAKYWAEKVRKYNNEEKDNAINIYKVEAKLLLKKIERKKENN